MGTQPEWAPGSPGARYRIGSPQSQESMTELTAVPTPVLGAAAAAQPWNPANPLFWFGGLALLTFGLMAVSTTVRVGGTRASVNVGKTT